MPAKLTPEACRAARALLRWSVRDLMNMAGVSPNTVTALEGGASVRNQTVQKITAAFAWQGVEITNGQGTGARLRAVWRIEEPKQGGGLTAHRYPASGEMAPILADREEVAAWLTAQGYAASANPDAWFEP